MIKSLTRFAILLSCIFAQANPDEGMWLPLHLQRFATQDHIKNGLKLTSEEIYNINNSSLKDALVMLGGGFCTAELVSNQGLIFTNHHCAYSVIQSHSSTQHDYLSHGFWAKNKNEELPNEGLTASILNRMEDVSSQIINAGKAKKQVIDSLVLQAQENGKYEAVIKSFFEDNEYYLFVYTTFKDVRLVGTPPSSIGKFGGDTDNWMWTRHTGDFAVLRIYADENGNPAEYDQSNQPYRPKKHLAISLQGYQENDFAMVMGFPGSTDRYLPSEGVKMTVDISHPSRITARRKKLDIIEYYMDKNSETRIKYASKHARISNYWKYFIGQTKGLNALNVYQQKADEETAFQQWAEADSSRKKYVNVVNNLNNSYVQLAKTQATRNYLTECIYGIELFDLALKLSDFQLAITTNKDQEKIDSFKEQATQLIEVHFKNYDINVDKALAKGMLKLYCEQVPFEQLSTVGMQLIHKHKRNYDKYVEKLYAKSILSNKEKLLAFIQNPNAKTLLKDQGFQVPQTIITEYQEQIAPQRAAILGDIKKNKKLYLHGLMVMNSHKNYYPDANSTPRFNPGKLVSYSPKDGVHYNYFTTTQGILEKENPLDDEFVVPEKLKTLIQNKDFDIYAKNDTLAVNFITDNDITGGNSGSPILNGKGELIGIAFDGNWEAMSGDIAFEHTYQRCIAVDIRFVLFIIDKYADAQHILNELTLVK